MKKNNQKELLLRKYGYKGNIYLMDMHERGPQNQAVIIVRFPVSYKHVKTLSRKVVFTSYFDWMGEVRELSFEPIIADIKNWLRTKEWGIATNRIRLNVCGFLSVGDVVEARMWLNKISGLDNIYHISFDWLKYFGSQGYERVAKSEMIISCVKIISHGKASIGKPPQFVKKYFDKMKPQSCRFRSMGIYKQQIGNKVGGKRLRDYSASPKLLFEKKYETSFEHSNFIGNVYFANYPKWADSLKDLFLFENYPWLIDERTSPGEFMTMSCSVQHKQEAMPFDRILARLYLVQVFEKKIVTTVRVFKYNENNELLELALLDQELIFTHLGDTFKVKKIPAAILQGL